MIYKTLDEQTRDFYYNEGFKKGYKEGFKKGYKEGIEESQMYIFNNFVKKGWTIEAARELVYGTDDK